MSDIRGEYGKSTNGNFFVKDTIGVPHPYCIGTKHVVYASDHCNGMLGNEAIEAAEKHGARCYMKGCNLRFDEHEIVLLVHCGLDTEGEEAKKELHDWLLSIKDTATENKYAGFVFVKGW